MKAQITIEFLFYVVLSVFFLLISVIFYAQRTSEVSEFAIVSSMKDICTRLSASAGFVYSGNNGTNLTHSFPQEIYGKNYSINVNGVSKKITVARDSSSAIGCLLSVNVSDGTSQIFISSKSPLLTRVNEVVVFG